MNIEEDKVGEPNYGEADEEIPHETLICGRYDPISTIVENKYILT